MKKEHLLLICIFIVGLVARILKFEDPVPGTDLTVYSHLGKNLIEHGRYVFGENFNWGVFSPPGYPVSIGLIDLFINDLFMSAKLVSVIASMITIFLFYLLGKELYDEESGLFAALVYAVYPVILILSVEAGTEALYFCFLFLSIYIFILSIRKDKFIMYPLLGVSFALSYLTRPEGVLLLFLPFLQFLGVFGRRPALNRHYIARISLLLIVFVLLAAPYMMFLKDYTGKFTLSGKANNILLLGELGVDREYHEVVNAPGNPYEKVSFALSEDGSRLVEWGREPNRSFKEYLFNDPVTLARRYLKNVLREVNYLVKDLIPILLPMFFVFFNRELFKNKIVFIFIFYPLLYFMMYPLFIIIERQVLIIVLFLVLFSSRGFVSSRQFFADMMNYYGFRNNRVMSSVEKNIKIIMIVILVISSLSYLKYTSYDKYPEPVEHIKAGYFIKNNISAEYEKFNIMARKPIVHFYSKSRFTMLPYAHGIDVVNFAKIMNVDYIVIDERLLSSWDHYDELIKLEKISSDIDLVYEDSSGKLIKLYKVNE